MFCLSSSCVFMCPMLSVSLDYPSLIASSVFSNVYLSTLYMIISITRTGLQTMNFAANTHVVIFLGKGKLVDTDGKCCFATSLHLPTYSLVDVYVHEA